MAPNSTTMISLLGLLLSFTSVSPPQVVASDDVRVTVGKPRIIYRGGNYPVLLRLANSWIIADFSSWWRQLPRQESSHPRMKLTPSPGAGQARGRGRSAQ